MQEYIRSLPVFTVGPATSSLIASYGFTNILGGAEAGNGSILASIISSLKPKYSRCVFFTGETHRMIIPKHLRENGIECIEKIVYISVELSDAQFKFRELLDNHDQSIYLWTVFFSPSGALGIANAIAKIRSENTIHLKVAAIGPTTEEFLIKQGITPDAVAKKPDPNSLLSEILNH